MRKTQLWGSLQTHHLMKMSYNHLEAASEHLLYAWNHATCHMQSEEKENGTVASQLQTYLL